jgi:hypothetical protein
MSSPRSGPLKQNRQTHSSSQNLHAVSSDSFASSSLSSSAKHRNDPELHERHGRSAPGVSAVVASSSSSSRS